MSGFVMKPRVLAPNLGEMSDTFASCKGRLHSAYKYAHGGARPHYQLPVPMPVADVATMHLTMSACPYSARGDFGYLPCLACLDDYMDSLEAEFPAAFGWVSDQPKTWAEMFPEGRTVFYEGTDPDGFVAEMKAKYNFDPSTSNRIHGLWALMIQEQDDPWGDCGCFLCPAHLLDEVYGSGKYPLGS